MAQCQLQQQLPRLRRRRCRCLVIDQYSITITITITPRVCGKLRLGKVNEKCVAEAAANLLPLSHPSLLTPCNSTIDKPVRDPP